MLTPPSINLHLQNGNYYNYGGNDWLKAEWQEIKKGKSRAEQKEIFEELLQSNEVKNRAEIARKFDVSRAWVSKVLNN